MYLHLLKANKNPLNQRNLPHFLTLDLPLYRVQKKDKINEPPLARYQTYYISTMLDVASRTIMVLITRNVGGGLGFALVEKELVQ